MVPFYETRCITDYIHWHGERGRIYCMIIRVKGIASHKIQNKNNIALSHSLWLRHQASPMMMLKQTGQQSLLSSCHSLSVCIPDAANASTAAPKFVLYLYLILACRCSVFCFFEDLVTCFYFLSMCY